MNVTYIQHSCFLVETDSCYYLFDYYKGRLPEMDPAKPIFVLSSHAHADHYNPEIFTLLKAAGMRQIHAVLSDDIAVPADVAALSVAPDRVYTLTDRQIVTTFRSTDQGVAYLIEDGQMLLYHAGDLNDWVWEEETDDYNRQMTTDYRKQMRLLAQALKGREIDTAFVVLDPRQEKDYDRGLCCFLDHIPVSKVYPMHNWGHPEIIETFLEDHPEYKNKIQTAPGAEKRML